VVVSGRVLSNTKECTPIPNAVVDIWQTESHGHYGSPYDLVEPGHCRARVLAAKDGRYEFETDIPGIYGMFSAMESGDSWLPMTAPYLPQHIHIASVAQGHNFYATQLYFPEDPARFNDPRFNLFGIELEATNSHNVLNLTRKGNKFVAENVDFVLVQNKSVSFTDVNAGIVSLLCRGDESFAMAWPICSPHKIWILAYGMRFATVFLFLIAALPLYVLYHLFKPRGAHSAKKNKKE